MAMKPMRPVCPPWCVTDHNAPVTVADGTPVVLPDGEPLTWKGHESAHEWTDAGTGVSLGQMPGGPLQVAVTALPAGTTLLAVEQARTLAGVLKADGAEGLGDAIARTLARLDGPSSEQDVDQAPVEVEQDGQDGGKNERVPAGGCPAWCAGSFCREVHTSPIHQVGPVLVELEAEPGQAPKVNVVRDDTALDGDRSLTVDEAAELGGLLVDLSAAARPTMPPASFPAGPGCPPWCRSTHQQPDDGTHSGPGVEVEQTRNPIDDGDGQTPAVLLANLRQQPGDDAPLIVLDGEYTDQGEHRLTLAETDALIGHLKGLRAMAGGQAPAPAGVPWQVEQAREVLEASRTAETSDTEAPTQWWDRCEHALATLLAYVDGQARASR